MSLQYADGAQIIRGLRLSKFQNYCNKHQMCINKTVLTKSKYLPLKSTIYWFLFLAVFNVLCINIKEKWWFLGEKH